MVHNIPSVGIVVLTSQEKWDKTWKILHHWYERVKGGELELPFKPLQSDRGFLVYVCNAYPALRPYLKGIHLMLEMWQGGRDAGGWKVGAVRHDKVGIGGTTDDALGHAPDLLGDKGFVTPPGPASGLTPIAP